MSHQPVAPTGARISEPVPGLYDGIDPGITPPDWYIFDEPLVRPESGRHEVVQITTKVIGPNGKTGWIPRGYDVKNKVLVMENAFLQDLPSWIEFGTPLVPGKGIPTVTYLTLRQMKLFRVQFGELTAVKMSTIQNVEAVMQLEQMKRSSGNLTLEQAVAGTHSVQYASTSIEQSGNTIVGVRIDTQNSWRWKLQEMMDYFGTDSAQRTKLFAKYGLRPEDEVLVNYDIWIDVAPHSKNSK